jgi:peptidoglycan/LPS O-acetylase OafA/YrhL
VEAQINESRGFRLAFDSSFYAPMFALFIIALAGAPRWLRQSFEHRALVYLGEISYGVYILQFPIHKVYESALQPFLNLSTATDFAAYVVLLLLVSAAANRWIERPLMQVLQGRRS